MRLVILARQPRPGLPLDSDPCLNLLLNVDKKNSLEKSCTVKVIVPYFHVPPDARVLEAVGFSPQMDPFAIREPASNVLSRALTDLQGVQDATDVSLRSVRMLDEISADLAVCT